MDKQTRNLIQKATQDARNLLEAEFAEQFEGVFDILLNGHISLSPGAHLTAAQRIIRKKIVAAIEHEKAGGLSNAEAVTGYLREASFTYLNRFVALKMLEARGLVQECVSKGDQSSGFKEFCGLAPGLGEFTDKGYRLYIESIFDELSTEIRVLFDRHDLSSVLWPRQKALESVLRILNREGISNIWGEDETIGWVYQYFNSSDERKKMREESAAPRNSRELAVRNQFFTPRYVVEFLTDNTLGRIWYEMRRGETKLAEDCRYLVRRPMEIFLGDPIEAYKRLGGHPEDGQMDVPDMVAKAFQGDLSDLPEEICFEAHWISLAIPPDQFEKYTGIRYQPFDSGPLDGLLEHREAPLNPKYANDLIRLWMALCHFRLTDSGSPYGFEPFETLWHAFRDAALNELEKENDLSQEELLEKPVLVPYRPIKDPRDLKILDPACGSGHFLLYAFDLLMTIYIEGWKDKYAPKSEATGKSLVVDYPEKAQLLDALPGLILQHNLHGIDIDARAVQIAALSLWMRAQKAYAAFNIGRANRLAIRKTNIVTAEPMPGEEAMRKEFTARIKPPVLGQLVGVVFEKMKLAGEAGSLLKIEEELKEAVAEARKQWLEGPKPDQKLLFPSMVDPRPKQLKIRFDLEGVTDEQFWEQAEDRILAALKDYAERIENGQGILRRLFAEDASHGFAFIDLCRKRYQVVLMNPPFGEASSPSFAYVRDSYPISRHDIYAAFITCAANRTSEDGKIGTITSRTGLFISSLRTWREKYLLGKCAIEFCADLGFEVLDAAVETAAYMIRKGTIDDSRNKSCLFLRCLDKAGESKASYLHNLVGGEHQEGKDAFTRPIFHFREIPGSPLAYWISSRVVELFRRRDRFEMDGRMARVSNETGDDFRFMRLWLELPSKNWSPSFEWVPHAKGGPFRHFSYDIHLYLPWNPEAKKVHGYIGRPNRPDEQLACTELFFRPGLTYPRRTNRFSLRTLPRGTIFSNKGAAVLVPNDNVDDLLAFLSLFNSSAFISLLHVQSAPAALAQSFEVGIFQNTPIPVVTRDDKLRLAHRGKVFYEMSIWPDRIDEFTHSFTSVGLFAGGKRSLHEAFASLKGYANMSLQEMRKLLETNDSECWSLYGLSESDQDSLLSVSSENLTEANSFTVEIEEETCRLLQWSIGCAFGRWDVRLAIDPSLAPKLPDPFDPLPSFPPGTLVAPDGFPAESGRIVNEEWLRARPDANTLPQESSIRIPTIHDTDYPLRVSWGSVLVDDSGFRGDQSHREDIVRRAREVFRLLWKDKAYEIEQEACDILGITDLRTYFRKDFFADHIKRYSKSRRKAPIYWQLSTPSASYSIWLYYHRFSKDTFYKVLNEFAAPKLQFEERELANARQGYGPRPTATQRKEIDAREAFVAELKTFKDEVARVAPLWNSDLNDGVIINFAPLWRLVPQNRSWQRECKACWDKLVAGEYDWAHLAMHLWPERVVPACAKDRSLAIAHALEDVFWEEDTKGKWVPKKVPKGVVEVLINERTSPTVKAALEELLKAPMSNGTVGKKGK